MASELMSGVLTANQAIGNINPMGNFVQGMQDSQDLQKKQMENAKTQYQQDLTVKLQRAIHESVDPATGNIDPDKFKIVAHQAGVDPQAIDYALDNVVKVWESAKKVAQAKNVVGAVSPTGAEKVQEGNRPSGAGWTTTKRGSTAAPAPKTSPEEDKTGFYTPDMLKTDKADIKGVGIEGEGQSAKDQTFTLAQEAPSDNIAPPPTTGVVSAISGITPETQASVKVIEAPTNPLKVADMDQDTQNAIFSQMRQEGKLGKWTEGKRADYIAKAQASLDARFQQYQDQVGSEPTKAMFIDKEGNYDAGAYNRALNEYNQKRAVATKQFSDDIGKSYGEQFSQEMTRQANRRAQVAQDTEQGKIASAGQAVEESTDNINKQLGGYGFKALSPLLMQNATGADKQALTNGAKAYSTVAELSRKLVEEKRAPTQAEVNGATTQIMALDGLGSTQSSEQKVSSLINSGFLSKLEAKFFEGAKTGEAFEDALRQMVVAKLKKGETLEDMAKNTSYPKLHAQFEGESGAFKGPGWTKKPAKAKAPATPPPAPKTEITRKAGESYADFLRRKAKGGK